MEINAMTRRLKTGPAHELAFRDIHDLLRRHDHNLSAVEILALASNLVGRLAAVQDEASITEEMIKTIIADNIARGNAEALAELALAAAPVGGSG